MSVQLCTKRGLKLPCGHQYLKLDGHFRKNVKHFLTVIYLISDQGKILLYLWNNFCVDCECDCQIVINNFNVIYKDVKAIKLK